MKSIHKFKQNKLEYPLHENIIRLVYRGPMHEGVPIEGEPIHGIKQEMEDAPLLG